MAEGQQTVISWPGYMYGDGLASKKLYCIHKRKTSEATVTKHLFRIEPARKYYYKKGLQSSEKSNLDEQRELERRRAQSEADYARIKEEYQGMPITYGQAVIIRHMFSNCFMSLEIDKTAKLVGNMQLSLLPEDNEYTNMVILPLSKLTKVGMPISYSHDITIANLRENRYYVHASEFLNSRDEGLEVNGSELKTEWRPQLFTSHKQYSTLYSTGNTLQPCEVVQIFNTSMIGGYLAASQISLADMIYKAKVITTGGNSRQLLNETPMEYTGIKDSLTVSSDVVISQNSNFYTLWEVQKVDTFNSNPIEYMSNDNIDNSAVRLKNVATQCYLSVDPQERSKLILTKDGLNSENIFSFSTRALTLEGGVLRKGDLLKIRDYSGMFIQPIKSKKPRVEITNSQMQYNELVKNSSESPQNRDQVLGISSVHEEARRDLSFGCSNRNDPNETTFEIIGGSNSLIMTANLLSSVYGQLVGFHKYLQDWAVLYNKEARSTIEFYNYELAETYEKELENETDLLNQTLTAVYEFLCLQRSRNQSLSQRKGISSDSLGSILSQDTSDQFKSHILSEMNILQLLVSIYNLISFKTIDTLLPSKSDKEDDEGHKKLSTHSALKSSGLEKFTLVPQVIARNRLDKAAALIVKILTLSALRNRGCSYYLSQKIDLFENSIDFRPDEIIELGQVIAIDLYCEETTFTRFYAVWTKLLEEITEKHGANIKRQILLLRLFTGLTENVSDPSMLAMVQHKLFSSLYLQKQNYRNLRILKFSLLNDRSSTSENRIKVNFNISSSSKPT
jgi:hypothetical protein